MNALLELGLGKRVLRYSVSRESILAVSFCEIADACTNI